MFISSTRAFVDVGTFHEDDEADPCDNIKHTDLVSLRPAHELEELASLGGGLHPGHQLRQRHNLLVDLEDPRPGHCDYLFFGFFNLWFMNTMVMIITISMRMMTRMMTGMTMVIFRGGG